MMMKKIFKLVLSSAVWLSFSAGAADLQVRVFERGGNVPLKGVAVCLGTHARLDQFGAVHTDSKGYALFSELPQAQILVTASKSGFKSEQENMVTSNLNRMLVLSLSGGGGGARCPISQQGTGLTSTELAVRRFEINDGVSVTTNRTVRLHNKLSGMATHYRASDREDMEGA